MFYPFREGLLKKVCPPVYKHLKKVNAEPMFYCTEWFLCAFTRTLPWDTLLRVWDIFLCEGVKVLFKTSLVILIGELIDHFEFELCLIIFSDIIGIILEKKKLLS